MILRCRNKYQMHIGPNELRPYILMTAFPSLEHTKFNWHVEIMRKNTANKIAFSCHLPKKIA